MGKNTNSKEIMDSVQPTGQTRYRKVRFGTSGKIRYTQASRRAHIKIMVLMVGTVALPIDRRAALNTSLMPQMK